MSSEQKELRAFAAPPNRFASGQEIGAESHRVGKVVTCDQGFQEIDGGLNRCRAAPTFPMTS